MTNFADRPRTLAGSALLLTVATQVFYLTVVSPAGDTPLRPTTWTVELATFALLALVGLVGLARDRSASVGWAALFLFGTFNVVQTGLGLAAFGPAQEAGEGVFAAILASAFMLYFVGKIFVGIAAVAFGAALFRGGSGLGKTFGALAVLSGLASAAINLAAVPGGREFTMAAGAAGTAAALFAGIALLLSRGAHIAE